MVPGQAAPQHVPPAVISELIRMTDLTCIRSLPVSMVFKTIISIVI